MTYKIEEYIQGKIYIVEYPIRFAGMDLFSRMTIVKLGDGTSGDGFASSLAIAGNSVIIGAYRKENELKDNAGAAYVFPLNVEPCMDIPVSMVTTDGSGQSFDINQQVTVTFTGKITTTEGLTTGTKKTVRICPSTKVDYDALGAGSCQINNTTSASKGSLSIGDKLVCTSKPDGSDTDSFYVKSGIY